MSDQVFGGWVIVISTARLKALCPGGHAAGFLEILPLQTQTFRGWFLFHRHFSRMGTLIREIKIDLLRCMPGKFSRVTLGNYQSIASIFSVRHEEGFV
jgi:hypothetical protein